MKPSSWTLRLEVRDLTRERQRLHTAGMEAARIQTVPTVIRYLGIRDPDNNALMFFPVLTADVKVPGGRAQGTEGTRQVQRFMRCRPVAGEEQRSASDAWPGRH